MSAALKILFTRKRRPRDEEGEREFKPLSGSVIGPKGGAVGWKTLCEQSAGKPRYKLDLLSQHADCEANYLRLRKILPNLEQHDEWLFEISSGTTKGQMCVSVVDRASYTTTLQITQPAESGDAPAVSLKAPKLIVCMYHDADMAEVVGWENHRRLQARYEYPNQQMYQSDEKAQLNRFLADWLTLYQAEGRVAFDLADIGLYK